MSHAVRSCADRTLAPDSEELIAKN
jgi:hypothetical protein